MDVSLTHSPLLLVVALFAAAALTWWTYGQTTPTVRGLRRMVLATLRFVALFIVILLLFEPIFRRMDSRDDPPILAVLTDVSESLSVAEGSTLIREALSEILEDDIRFYSFDANATRLLDFNPDSLRFNGGRTDIARGLNHVERDLNRRNLRGILLISDGRYNTGRNPLYLAERFKVPIYTTVIGDTTARRDVRTTRIVTNEVAYLGTQVPVRVGVRASGFEGERVTVSLSDGGRRIQSEAITLPEDGVEVTVDLFVTPTSPGIHYLTGSVSQSPGEVTYRNNAESAAVRVLDTKRHVLMLAAAPGPDLTALRTVLEADRNTELTTLTQRAPGSFYEGSLPENLTQYDLLILAGYPGRAADPSVAVRVAGAIEGGLSALFILTQQTDLNRLSTAFGDALPVRPEVIRPGFSEAGFVISPAGSTHPALQVPDVEQSAVGGLPPVLINESRWSVAPDARVLATQRRGGVALNDPLLVVRSRGNSRTAAFLGAGTWRWANVPADLEALSGFFPGLMENLMQWTTARTDRRRVRVRPTHAQFGEREPVTFAGQVYDESLNPIEDADLRVTVAAPGGSQTPFTMRPVGNGRYTLNAGVLTPGSYTFRARAERAGEALGTDAGAFSVGSLALEFREPGADAVLMRQLALRSGGRVVPIADVPSLRDQLASEGRFEANTIEQERETPLLHLPFLLAIVIAALTLEWFLRKRGGMV